MIDIWVNTLLSTLIVSVMSLAGVLFLAFKLKILQKIVFILVSFAVGALLGNAFFILIPESEEMLEGNTNVGLFIVGGILLMFVIEKLIHWHHNHNMVAIQKKEAPVGYISLFTDGIHNFIDGILIASAWMVSPEIGFATTVAVIAHEIPQEISDFGILIHAGFSRRKALFFNFMAACTAIAGAIATLWLGVMVTNISTYALPLAAGGFIYLASSDLIPELHHEKSIRKSSVQLVMIIAGLALMLYIGQNHEHNHEHQHEHTEECNHEH